jgi:hypothetical protein
MKLRREARTLKGKALSSVRKALTCFNGFEEDGRVTAVLLHAQHACEMLLKAMLVQKGVKVFNDKTAISEGFAKCVNLAGHHCGVTDSEAGLMRAIDSLRDAEQHWIVVVAEGVLYLHMRSLVTVFDDILNRFFSDTLADHLPTRVLPVSTAGVTDLDVLVDAEYSQIAALLQPGRRARDEARGRIRTLLAMESHVVDEVAVSERDIDRVEKAIKGQTPIEGVFPRLRTLATNATGEGFEVRVHFTKKEGAPVQFVRGDDPVQAAAVREIDLQKRFHWSASALATKLGLTGPKATYLRKKVGAEDAQCLHFFEFGSQKIPRYSDNALTRMKEALAQKPIEEWWAERNEGG